MCRAPWGRANRPVSSCLSFSVSRLLSYFIFRVLIFSVYLFFRLFGFLGSWCCYFFTPLKTCKKYEPAEIRTGSSSGRASRFARDIPAVQSIAEQYRTVQNSTKQNIVFTEGFKVVGSDSMRCSGVAPGFESARCLLELSCSRRSRHVCPKITRSKRRIDSVHHPRCGEV